MQKELIIKLKSVQAKQDRVIMETSKGKWEVSCVMGIDDLIFNFLGMLGLGLSQNEKFLTKMKLNNLNELVYNKFSIRIDQTEENYILIIAKDKSSISFRVSKDQGITQLLIQAEDWAETMLEDLNKSNNV